ncbi:MAG: hypothetical protein M3071_04990, partial [Actinomycetota bacterium]|nr:hypothetical protein [Actinomycetota bacterium]
VLAVIRMRHTDRRRAEALRHRLASIGAPVLGLVLNAVEREPHNAYAYGYGRDASRNGTAQLAAASNSTSSDDALERS